MSQLSIANVGYKYIIACYSDGANLPKSFMHLCCFVLQIHCKLVAVKISRWIDIHSIGRVIFYAND
jgi:hypothetical protein